MARSTRLPRQAGIRLRIRRCDVADCFIKIEQINGEAQDQDYADFIQVDSWQWGANWRSAIQGSHGGQSGVGQLNSLTFVHAIDSASPGLFARCVKNAVIPTAKLIMRRAGGTAQKYLTLDFEKVRIVSVEVEHDARHVIPSERVVLNFDRVKYEYTPQSQLGSDKSGRSTFEWIRTRPDD